MVHVHIFVVFAHILQTEAMIEKIVETWNAENNISPNLDTLANTPCDPIPEGKFTEVLTMIEKFKNSEASKFLLGRVKTLIGKDGEASAVMEGMMEAKDGRFTKLYLQALRARGLLYERSNEYNRALACYKNAESVERNLNEHLLYWIEENIYRIPFVLLKMKNTKEALDAFRSFLMRPRFADIAKQSSAIRNTMSLLLTHFNNESYVEVSKSIPKSKYTPKSLNEEIQLLILALDHINSSEVTTKDGAEGVANGLTLGLEVYSRPEAYVDFLEHHISLGSKSDLVFRKYVLALVSVERYEEAMTVVKHCNLEDAETLLIAAKVCLNNLSQPEECIAYASKGLKLAQGPIQARFYCLRGVGYAKFALRARDADAIGELQTKAIENMKKAVEMDENNFEYLYYLALEYAETRQIGLALTCAKRAVALNSNHKESWHLLILLLSAQKNYEMALNMCESVIQEFENDLSLIITKAYLTGKVHDSQKAITVLRTAFSTYRNLQSKAKKNKKAANSTLTSAAKNLAVTTNFSSTVRQSSGLGIVNEDGGKRVIDDASMSLLNLWLHAANFYQESGQMEQARKCIQEAYNIDPFSPEVYLEFGRLSLKNEEPAAALQRLETVLTLDAAHLQGLISIGVAYIQQDKLDLAESTLTAAIDIDPTIHEAWYHLGLVLNATGRHNRASECFLYALDLERTSPVRSFRIFERSLIV